MYINVLVVFLNTYSRVGPDIPLGMNIFIVVKFWGLILLFPLSSKTVEPEDFGLFMLTSFLTVK